MKVQLVHPFALPTKEVLALFFSPDVIRERNQRLGSRHLTIQRLEQDEDEVHLEFSREMQASAPVPGALRSFQKDWNRVIQKERWYRINDAEWACDYRVHIADVPARLQGSMQLKRHPKGCANHVELDVECRIPLLGRKVASFLSEDSALKINREYEVLLDLIGR